MSQHAPHGSTRRIAAIGAAAALALAMIALPPLPAPAAAAGWGGVAAAPPVAAPLTDVGAAKRKRRAVRRGPDSSAAGMAFMGMAMGMMGAAIAESQRRDYYDRRYGYYGYAPGYYHRPYRSFGGYYGRPDYYGY